MTSSFKDPVYTRENGTVPLPTDPKLVRIGLAFTTGLLEPFQYRTATHALLSIL